ncbi:TetR family transcriptional regulator [Actinomadura sp. KC216]|uniref:TetR/AcrR family transcriptional regulator n=1 Tax=Actinomadura sp. KC216 TaxID=2530370 RepID=UPI00104D53F7|nr:TetR family transcriptional regulator [Actinomadura sp. KC216]TDB83770.1 TetR family transcriptional regulator [Actinomadura sp. KC216]
MATTGGLRERKKEATRRALHDAAMRLAAEHGLDDVTVEAIADAAGVSRRTFSNYFGGKEEALLYGAERRMRALLEAFEARPRGEPSWTALRAALDEQADGDGETACAPVRAEQARLAREHPAVMARLLAHYAGFERDFADLIAAREGLPPGGVRPRVLAGAFMTALRIATLAEIDERPARHLADATDETLAEMARPFQ